MSHHSSLCGEFTGSRIDLITGEVRAGAIWCKSWYCEHCAPIRKKQLMAQAAQGNPEKFITLTSRYRPEEMTPDQAARELVHAWRMVIQRGKREKRFQDVQYIAVFEQTENGWPHLHILARVPYIDQTWLSERMAEYTNSPIVDIRKVRSRARAAWYIAKYTAKEPEKFKGCKRYWRTMKYALEIAKKSKPLHSETKGIYSGIHVKDLADFYESHGYDLAWTSEHSFVAVPLGLDVWARARAENRTANTKPYKRK